MRWGSSGLNWAASVLVTVSLAAGGQNTSRPNPDVVKRADEAFRAGVSARESGNLEVARSKFADVVRLQPRFIWLACPGQRAPIRVVEGSLQRRMARMM
jgi:hypothetical protein